MVFWLALRSRLLVVAWCIAADFLFPDHQPRDVLLYSIDRPPRPSLPLCFLRPFTRWDAAHFLTIARDGYRSQRDVAFFPGFPWLVSTLARTTSFSSHATTVVICGVVVSNLAFIAAACGVRAAAGIDTARAFCLSPAAVFFSSNYAESLFAALTFWGIAHSRNRRPNTAMLLLAMAATVRSNGVLGAILLIDGSLLSAGRAVFVLLPFALHEAVSRARFRSAGSSLSNGWPPPISLYVDVQRQYWDVGVCHYWQFKQLPNFVLATPAIMLACAGLLSLPHTSDKGSLALHTLASLFLLVFVSHVEIATRLLAASSLPFLQALSRGLQGSTFVRLYVATFIVIGSAAHVNNLPWT